MRLERRAEEPRSKASEGTEQRRNEWIRIPGATTTVANRGVPVGRSGETAESRKAEKPGRSLRTF
jgi:hypothetical protein